jgi:hypothetical protein
MDVFVNGARPNSGDGGGGPSGGIAGPIASIDNELVRFDGGLGDTVQGTGIIVSDNGNINLKTMDASDFGRKLGIAGTGGAMTTGLSGGAWMEFQSTSGNDQQLVWVTNESGVSHGIRMTLNKTGFLGIGESSPSQMLHVAQNARVDGNLGLGGIAPAQKLEITQGNILLGRQDAGDFSRLIGLGSNIGGMSLGASGGSWIGFYQSSNSNGIDFITNDATVSHARRMRITPSGRVGVGVDDPVARHHVNGSQAVKITDTATSYTALADDYLIRVTSTAAARTITLPTAASIAGRVYEIKDASGGAATNNITINADGTETIDGELTQAIISNYGSIKIVSDGTNWSIVKHATNGVEGPAGSNADAVALWDGVSGRLLKDSQLYVNGSGWLGVGTDSPNSRLMVTGSVSYDPGATATNLTLDDSHHIVYVTDTSAARTITLPSTAACGGRVYGIVDYSQAAGTNNITINPNGSDTIAGTSSYVIRTNGGAVFLQADAVGGNTNWSVIGERKAGRYSANAGGTVASANDLTLTQHDYVSISGTTEVQRINTTGWTAGSQIKVLFSSTPTIKHNQSATLPNAPILVDGGSDYAPTAGSIATLFYNGSNFYLSPFYTA